MSGFTFGSLFSGIGGLDLGLERAGWECRWQVEIDDYCRRVLAKHWPDVPKYGDIRELTGGELERVDLIAGGFPCQDISDAGGKAGLDGAQSGLWVEYVRLVRILRPRFVLVENVAALLRRGMGRVLQDLAESGYDAEWDCIPAAAIGAPHIRDRLFVLAYPALDGRGPWWAGRLAPSGARQAEPALSAVAHADRLRAQVPATRQQPAEQVPQRAAWWTTEPGVGRVADGVPARLDRLRGLGNAVVPQVAEYIGRRILDTMAVLR